MNTAHFINGSWISSKGPLFNSVNPATEHVVWQGNEADNEIIELAIKSASDAFATWSLLPLQRRIEYLHAFAKVLTKQKELFAKTICEEIGKPFWESLTEVSSMIAKVDISIKAQLERCPNTFAEVPQGTLVVQHRPHGVLAIPGPFNFPGHLPNGHIIPALLAGNTLIFKPSELAPKVGELTAKCWEQTLLPKGVFNMIQGGAVTGKALTSHPKIQGVLFTGSWNTGVALSEMMGKCPDKILALEMGGNNPLVIGSVKDPKAAAYTIVQSAFLTSGQRCTCARRLILQKGEKNKALIELLIKMVNSLAIGPYTANPEPFMGPVVSKNAAKKIMNAYQELLKMGGTPLLPMKQLALGAAFLSPGIVDMTGIHPLKDEEIFGPLLQVFVTNSFEDSIKEANNTAFGLSAGLLSDDESEYEYFQSQIKAGVINWNTPLTGASSQAPFGGIRKSGNHRPSAYLAADYCSYPTASIQTASLNLPKQILPGVRLRPEESHG